jgi:hypothetical protein
MFAWVLKVGTLNQRWMVCCDRRDIFKLGDGCKKIGGVRENVFGGGHSVNF